MSLAFTRREALAALAAAGAFPAFAAQRELEVPFVPTPHTLVQRMLNLAGVGPEDFLIDLGCGDGRIAVAAAQRGARALGVDLDPLRLQEAAAAARIAGVESRVRFRRQDLFRTPIFEASVVALYLLPRINLELRPKLLTELHAGARVVSHAFHMGDWRPDGEEEHDGRRIYLWIVPAIAGGSWALTDDQGNSRTLELEQRFQEVTGTLSGAGATFALRDTRLRGTELRFTVDDSEGPRRYEADIDGATMTARPGSTPGWQGRRIG